MIELIVVILILGVICWAAMALPIPQPFKIAVYAILIIAAILYIAAFFGHPVARFPR